MRNERREFIHIPVEELNPEDLYTNESFIFKSGLGKTNLKDKIITFGIDTDGNKFVCDGNHHSYQAFVERQKIKGQQVCTAKFSIINDPSFRLIKDLKVLE